VVLEDLAEADPKDIERELEEEINELRRKKLACF
jgi:hypothetical protein